MTQPNSHPNPRHEFKTGSKTEVREFRNALGQFPTGVCVVTAHSPGLPDQKLSEDLGMTISSFNSLSLAPPLIVFSIDKRAYSLRAWQDAKGYAVNILAQNQQDISNRFARPLSNKWQGLDFDRGFAQAPLLRGVAASFECAPYAMHEGGDHILFIAEVIRFESSTGRAPLFFCKGNYSALKDSEEAAPLWPLAIHY